VNLSLKDKVKSFIGIDEEDFFEEEFEISVPEKQPMINPVTNVNREINVAPTNVRNRQSLRAVEQPKQVNKGQVSTVNAMMNKVIIREPKDYSDAQNIADCLKESLPVFINLQSLDKGQGRRIIDFLSGTIYAVDGEIKRVGNDLFLCTPKSVATDGTVTESKDDLTLGDL